MPLPPAIVGVWACTSLQGFWEQYSCWLGGLAPGGHDPGAMRGAGEHMGSECPVVLGHPSGV